VSKVLFAENENDGIKSFLKFSLARHRVVVDTVSTIQQTQENLVASMYDLLILGWYLPDGSGIELLKQLRDKGSQIKVLILTEHDTPGERLNGFEAGADDCLSKPFHVNELICRIQALLRRPARRLADIITEGDLVLDLARRTIRLAGQELRLRPKEFALLELFMTNPNRYFSAEVLLMKVWEADSESSPHTVVSTIHRLRKKIHRPGGPSKLLSGNAGYHFFSHVEQGQRTTPMNQAMMLNEFT
jgi:DNA-binding response OmpR family regulator